MIAKALTFRTRDGGLVPSLDARVLRKAAEDAVDDVELSKPRDATVKISRGKPVVVPAVDGTSVSAEAGADRSALPPRRRRLRSRRRWWRSLAVPMALAITARRRRESPGRAYATINLRW